MSWTPELYIGGMRPWPDSVAVVRSQTDETKTYVPEDVAENAELRDKYETLESAYDVIVASCRAKAERINDLEDLLAKNGLPTGGTGKNAKLRELVADIWPFAKDWLSLRSQFGIGDTESYDLYMRMRELGVEVDE